MIDPLDTTTRDIFAVQLPPLRKKIGRPRKADAKSNAERVREFRAREKARLAALKDTTRPVTSSIIDLSALHPRHLV